MSERIATEDTIPDCGGDSLWDHDAFADCLRRAQSVREGYWSLFATLAWVASRDEDFVAAVQLFESETYGSRGRLFSAAAWFTIGNEAGERFGVTLTGAAETFRVALETGKVGGGIAKSQTTREVSPVPDYLWSEWQVAHLNDGLQIIPGWVDLKWPSTSVRVAFPAPEPATNSDTANQSAFSGRGRPTDRQREVFKFFELGKQYLKDGSRQLNATELRTEYLNQFRESGRLSGKPLNRSAFEDMLRRYYDGWRINGRRWQMSETLPG